ncbi:glucosamine-6-phosphate deaminase [Clostridia bacterium]|nr:glucosamine-6-phosphate deaminase [Clostridia bacterium]
MNGNKEFIKSFYADKMKVKIYGDRVQAGKSAAADIAALLKTLLKQKTEINMMFAAAPSQEEFLSELVCADGIAWDRINAYHMDEYIGLPADAPQNFGNFLRIRLFEKVKFKSVYYINGARTDAEAECARYAQLFAKKTLDIVCMGIGENGHIAFNDPHVALFNDSQTVKIVTLDEACRRQQVNDGCFPTITAVPKNAITLTIPALMSAAYIICVVPGRLKANAVRATVKLEISEQCPASILRMHEQAVLYCDADSGEYIL